jgi:CMP/dCMP kinase
VTPTSSASSPLPARQGPRRGKRIAIDGPAASGKSSLGAALADRLGYTYVDSGVVYRAVTLLALRQEADLADAGALARIAQDLRIQVSRPTAPDGRQYTVLVNGEDVTWALRAPEVDAAVSAVSAVPAVRQAAYHHLRRLISPQGTVMVGRDIGTVVMPDADLKLYLSASPESRAARRTAELQARGQPGDYDFILRDQYRRDAYDGSRSTAPMRPAEDALVLVNDDLDVEAEVALVLQHLDHVPNQDRVARQDQPPSQDQDCAGGEAHP